MQQAIQDGRCQGLVTEDFSPVNEALVRGQYQAGPLHGAVRPGGRKDWPHRDSSVVTSSSEALG